MWRKYMYIRKQLKQWNWWIFDEFDQLFIEARLLQILILSFYFQEYFVFIGLFLCCSVRPNKAILDEHAGGIYAAPLRRWQKGSAYAHGIMPPAFLQTTALAFSLSLSDSLSLYLSVSLSLYLSETTISCFFTHDAYMCSLWETFLMNISVLVMIKNDICVPNAKSTT